MTEPLLEVTLAHPVPALGARAGDVVVLRPGHPEAPVFLCRRLAPRTAATLIRSAASADIHFVMRGDVSGVAAPAERRRQRRRHIRLVG